MNLTTADIPAVAESIAGCYLREFHKDRLIELPHELWKQAEYQWSRWRSEALRLLDFGSTPSRLLLESNLRELIEALQTWLTSAPLLPVDDDLTPGQQLAAELHSLLQEFGEVIWNPEKLSLSVTTPRIVLQEIDLGPFEIHLAFSRLQIPPAYDVIPLDPTFFGGDSEYPHPHVQGTHLCEGEGSTLIRSALQAGRLSDFFLIVSLILQTYNPESPYRSLDDWWLESCHACGDSVDPDDLSHCSNCSNSLCPNCGSSCEECQALLCNECYDRCSLCNRVCCSNCSGSCSACDLSPLCQECLDDQSHCPDCRNSNVKPEPSPGDSSESSCENSPNELTETLPENGTEPSPCDERHRIVDTVPSIPATPVLA